jgi:hypothetical protein
VENTPFEGGAIQKTGQAIRFDPLNPGAGIIDLGTLSQQQRDQLVMEYMRGTLDMNKKAAEMHVDVTAFKNMLDVMATKTKELAAQEGTSVTMQHTQESSVGRTEVIIGNTEQAAKGRLTRSMTGERNLTLVYFAVGVVAVLILVALFLRH